MNMTATSVTPLDPLQFPLTGSRLIEASAGTGKTFTLALLYVRLILGGGPQDFSRPLNPKEILVVTFTELAAGELRDRIRARLVEAAAYFRNPQQQDDALLVSLRASYPSETWQHCAWRLQMASEGMDEASISTIHSWCNRMLIEHAFDTHGLFARELITDTAPLLKTVVEDFWRVHFYTLPEAQAQLLSRYFPSPEALAQALKPLLSTRLSGVCFAGQIVHSDAERIRTALADSLLLQQQQQSAQQQLQAYWRTHFAAIEDYLLAIRPALNGSTHSSSSEEKFLALLSEIQAWAQGNAEAPSKLASFATGSFKFNKGKEPSEAAPAQVEQAFAQLRDYLTLLQSSAHEDLAALVLAHARQWVSQECQARLQQQAQMSFDDLLLQLEHALNPAQGAAAQRLASSLKQAFPVAMIDEFQDTDPIQYRIFDAIYQLERNHQDSGLFMIGDPKQSIYSFRGGDIHTYLAARVATAGRHYSLSKNFRSTAPLVEACNAFFSFAEQHPQGAFGYRTDNDNPIPFLPVAPAGRSDRLLLNQREVDALTLWYFDEFGDAAAPLATQAFRHQAAQVAASQIAHWLTQANQGLMGFGNERIERPLQAADIAILVRTGSEAQLIQQALNERQIPSVYLSDRESLFASQEAEDVCHWLRACATPTSESLVKAALGTLTLNLPLRTLLDWQQDELAAEAHMQRFADLQQIWRRQGVLVMLQRLLEMYQLPNRLLQQPQGERSLTNLLHLGEWLQQAATELDGEQALIRLLAEHLQQNDDSFLLRLESDAQRIKILTIHKSKGLEFPLVLLPFIGAWKEINGTSKTVTYRLAGESYSEVSDSKRFAQAWQFADAERIKEDLRLLYVALTRASYALWMGVGPLKSGNSSKPQLHKSAIGHILNGGEPYQTVDEVQAQLALLAQHPNLCLINAPRPDQLKVSQPLSVQLEPARQAPNLSHLRHWWIASYSALQFSGGQDLEPRPDEPSSAREDQHYESQEPSTALAPLTERNDLHGFPRGAKWGTFLHSLLEWAAQAGTDGFASAASDAALREEWLDKQCRLRNIDNHAGALNHWLQGFLQLRWPTTGFALCELPRERIAVELEFWLHANEVDVLELDRLISAYSLKGQSAPKAQANEIHGMLKGFIDLVAEHDGRYYVIDWKSNHLGDTDEAYSQDAMQQAIWEHRYDVQYMLYLLALHRHLRARLPDYNYQQHLGGAVYCFVRGWQHPETQGMFFDRPPQQLIEALDRLFSHASQQADEGTQP